MQPARWRKRRSRVSRRASVPGVQRKGGRPVLPGAPTARERVKSAGGGRHSKRGNRCTALAFRLGLSDVAQ